jgi:hypothetical protein
MRCGPLTVAVALVGIISGISPAHAGSVQKRTWEELQRDLPGKKIRLVLPSGEVVQGRCESVGEKSLIVMSLSRKPRHVNREQVHSILVVQRKGPWRAAMAAGLGFGAAAVAAAAVGSLKEGAGAYRQIGAVYGAAGAGVVVGYLVGRRLDDQSYQIDIIQTAQIGDRKE